MNESNSFKYIPAMAMIQTPSEIEARLQALINSTSLQLPTCMDDNGPLVIFYAHRDIAAPDLQSHHFFLTLTTGRSQVLFREFEAESLLHETLENRVIFHIDIHDSNLRNCTLISCAVHGGRFEACHFKDCQFAEKKLSIDERGNVSNSKAQIISHSHVENGSMCDAEISNSSLKSVNRLRNCQLNNSLLVESVASESSFNNCGIHDSKLHNCTVVDGLQTDSVISTITTFRAFPAEIRKMIYEEILENDEAALGLMAAFRPDSLLYGEILELCFQRVTFVLSSKNLKALKSTPDFVRRRITKIKLKASWMIPTNDVAIHFPTGTRITDITMEFVGGQHKNINVQAFYDVCRLWFKYFATVKMFTVVWTNDRTHNPYDFTRRRELEGPTALMGAIRVANEWIKRKAVCVKGLKDINETLTWTWIAEEGDVLGWNSWLLDHQP